MIKKIISGGQKGDDQGTLDAAIKLDISHGGWIPRGRITEAGTLPDKYKLQEMATDSYEKRTLQNVLDSDGTVIESVSDFCSNFLNSLYFFTISLPQHCKGTVHEASSPTVQEHVLTT